MLSAFTVIGASTLLALLCLQIARFISGALSASFQGIWSIKALQTAADHTFTAHGIYKINKVVASIDKLSINFLASNSVITTYNHQTGYSKNYSHATRKPASHPASTGALFAGLLTFVNANRLFLNAVSFVYTSILLLPVAGFNWLNSNRHIPAPQLIYRPLRSLSKPLKF